MKGFRFGNKGTFVNAVKTTKRNKPTKNDNEPNSDAPICHCVPTVDGMIILKKST